MPEAQLSVPEARGPPVRGRTVGALLEAGVEEGGPTPEVTGTAGRAGKAPVTTEALASSK